MRRKNSQLTLRPTYLRWQHYGNQLPLDHRSDVRGASSAHAGAREHRVAGPGVATAREPGPARDGRLDVRGHDGRTGGVHGGGSNNYINGNDEEKSPSAAE